MAEDQAPISFRYDAEKRRRIAIFRGVVEDTDLFGGYNEILKDPDYDAGADDLVDLSEVTEFGVTEPGLQRLILLFAPIDQLGIPTRLAIVAPGPEVYGVSRMYQALRGDGVPEEIEVFRTRAEAEAWLDRR